MTQTDWDDPSESPSTPPPSQTLAWVEANVAKSVVSVRPLDGGISSSVHRLGLGDVLGNDPVEADSVVLRRYTLAAWIEREPNVPHDEAKNLAMLTDLDLGVTTPRLIAADPDGTHCDAPAIVMTEVPGAPDLAPEDPFLWALKFAETLARMHQQPAVDGLPDYRRWDHPDRKLPMWTQVPDAWRRAKEQVRGDLPTHPVQFLHRDFHPCNVHWLDGEVCAVVDWLGACNGPIAADLAHCRWNIAILTEPQVADHFTDHYRSLTGYSEDVTAYDLATVLSGPVGPFPTFAWNALGRTDLTSDSVAVKIDAWLEGLLA